MGIEKCGNVQWQQAMKNGLAFVLLVAWWKSSKESIWMNGWKCKDISMYAWNGKWNGSSNNNDPVPLNVTAALTNNSRFISTLGPSLHSFRRHQFLSFLLKIPSYHDAFTHVLISLFKIIVYSEHVDNLFGENWKRTEVSLLLIHGKGFGTFPLHQRLEVLILITLFALYSLHKVIPNCVSLSPFCLLKAMSASVFTVTCDWTQ